MIEGEDRSVWCEANGLTNEQAQEKGEELCQRYENAHWWIESEDVVLPQDYEDWEEEDEY